MDEFSRCTLGDVQDALQFVSADCDRQQWATVGMGIKHEFCETGFSIWDEWSKTSDKYNSGDALSTWRSIKSFGANGSVTVGTVFKLAIDNGYSITHTALSDQEKAERDKEAERRRLERIEREAEEVERIDRWHNIVASAAQDIFSLSKPTGKSKYLGRKKVGAFGIRFLKHGIVVVTDDESQAVNLIHGSDEITSFFGSKADDCSFKYLRAGTIAVPMHDVSGLINLQLIYSSGKKSFLKFGRKIGTFHQIGDIRPDSHIAFVEGYATGASVHLATGWPVIVTFDAGNLVTVAEALRQIYKSNLFVVAGDDDRETKGNPGRQKALEAASKVHGLAVLPQFSEAVNE